MGRAEVVAAVLTHAADLFAERGPAATSIRDIATRSGVNHGLIFRHFGAKDQLVAAVLDYLGAHSAELIEAKADRAVLEAQVERQWKVLARAILDGYEVGKLQQRFPTMSSLVDQIRSATTTIVRPGSPSPIPLPWKWVGDCSSRSCARPPDYRGSPNRNCARRSMPRPSGSSNRTDRPEKSLWFSVIRPVRSSRPAPPGRWNRGPG